MDEEFSCIKQVKKTVQLPVPLSFVTKEITGISEILDSWKRQYVKSLHGIVVDYKNVSLTSRTGFIGINNPFIYYNVTATFDLFCPNIGDIVKGRINRISREHIGCLIQGTINVTIHLSRNSSTELSQFLNLNREILFEISHFDYERKMIRVTGQITPKCIQLMKDLFPPDTPVTSTHVHYSFDDETGSNRENPNDSIFDPLTDCLNQNNIEQSDVKSEVLPKNSSIKIKKSKKTKNESEPSIFSEISSMSESSDEETEIKNKSMLNQSSNIHQYNSVVENFSSINSGVPEYVKKEVSPKKEIQKKGHRKKRKRESSLSESENKKKKKKCKDKVEKINGLSINSLDNVDLTDVTKYIKQEVSSSVQPVSTTEENESITSTILSDKLKTEKKKKKHKDKKSDASKKHSSKKNKLKKKKSKVSASGDVLKKDKKSKKHKGSKSHKKIKSEGKKGKKTHNSKKKKPSVIKSEVS